MLQSHPAWASTKRSVEDSDKAPLVESLETGKFIVKQMLIDTGSAANVLFHDAIAQMGILDYEIYFASYL